MTLRPHTALALAHQRAADLQAEAARCRKPSKTMKHATPAQPASRPEPAEQPALAAAPAKAQSR